MDWMTFFLGFFSGITFLVVVGVAAGIGIYRMSQKPKIPPQPPQN